MKEALKEMTVAEQVLNDELSKSFALKVDLRTFEDVNVTLDDGEVSLRFSCRARFEVEGTNACFGLGPQDEPPGPCNDEDTTHGDDQFCR